MYKDLIQSGPQTVLCIPHSPGGGRSTEVGGDTVLGLNMPLVQD